MYKNVQQQIPFREIATRTLGVTHDAILHESARHSTPSTEQQHVTLSAQRNETVSKQFCFSFTSLCGQLRVTAVHETFVVQRASTAHDVWYERWVGMG